MEQDLRISELKYLAGTETSYNFQDILNYLNNDQIEYLFVISQANTETWKLPGHIIWNKIKSAEESAASALAEIRNKAYAYLDGSVSVFEGINYNELHYKSYSISSLTASTPSDFNLITFDNNTLIVPEKINFLQLSINVQTKHSTNKVIEWFEDILRIGYYNADNDFIPFKYLRKEHTNDSSIFDDTFTFSINMNKFPIINNIRKLELRFMCGFSGTLDSSSYQMSLVQI